jgi:hypothetical protein
MIISAIPSIIQSGYAIEPFALSLYMLAVGAAMFKPNIAPTVLDQNPHKKPHVITNKDGSKAIVDPEATSESVMLWYVQLCVLTQIETLPFIFRLANISQVLPPHQHRCIPWSCHCLPG